MSGNGRYLHYVLHAAILGGLIWAGVKYVNGAEVLSALQRFETRLLPLMLALSLAFFLLMGARFAILMGPFAGHLPARTVVKGYIAGQAATLLPGGIAARAGLMKQVGVPIADSSVPVVVHSGYDQLLLLSGSLVAALLVAEARLPVLSILGVLIAVTLLLLMPRTRQGVSGLVAQLARRLGAEAGWERFLQAVPQVFTRRIVLACLAVSGIVFLINVLILALTLRGLALSVPYAVLLLAFILPTMLGRIVPIPGGVGVTEAGMVGFLIASTQLEVEATVAAVAIFRLVTIVFPALLGALVYFLFWRGARESTGPGPAADTGVSAQPLTGQPEWMPAESISAVIPAYNEGDHVGRVLNALTATPGLGEIIVVDDGSTDNTVAVVEAWRALDKRIALLSLGANRGKGGALYAGAAAAQNDLLLFLDADLMQAQPWHFLQLIEPVRRGDSTMTLGIFQHGRRSTDLAHHYFPFLSGQRCLRWSLYADAFAGERARWGIETAFNLHAWYHRYPVRRVTWSGVTHASRQEKQEGWIAFLSHVRMWLEIGHYTVRFFRTHGRRPRSVEIPALRAILTAQPATQHSPQEWPEP